jgi:hypothetical protein
MPVSLPVELTGAKQAAETAARDIASVFNKFGVGIGGDFGRAIGRGISAFDTGPAVRQLEALEAAYRRTADAERAAADRMVARQLAASAAVDRYGQDSAKAASAAALANKSQRDYTDALVANEGAHRSWQSAAADSAAGASMLGRTFDAVGVGSVLGLGVAFTETTKKAGDFQQSQQRLVSSAGETVTGLKTVSDGILHMTGQVGYSAQDLSKGMYTVEKAGFDAAHGGVDVLRASAQLAKAENADLGEVLNGLTTSMHDFGFGSDQAATVASKMNTAVGLAKTNLQEFSGALHSVEPIAAAAGLKLEDVYGSLAQITQSGTSADQAAQNMSHSITSLIKPTQQMRDEMGQLGIDARDVQAHLGDRGYAGTVQMLSDTIRQHMNPAQQVVIDTMFQSQQATDAATQMFNNLPPAAKAVAESIKDGTLSFKEFRKSRGGLSVEDANIIQQWNNLNNKVEGFSGALKSGQGDIQTYEQALALMTGGQDSLRTVLQLVGDNAQATNDKIAAVKNTTAETDGTVKGFNETQQTLNAKMADAKAAFGAAAIELGTVFVPTMTEVAKGAQWVGDELAKHPGIAEDVTGALGLMGGAWLLIKGYNLASTVLSPIASGLEGVLGKLGGVELQAGNAGTAMRNMGTAAAEGVAGVEAAASAEVAAEGRVATSAAEADAAMAGGGAAGGGGFRSGMRGFAGALPVVGPIAMGLHDVGNQINPDNSIDHQIENQGWGHALFGDFGDWITGHAHGGPIHGPGPRGHDSVPMWGAPGEHVLTHHDVAAMGGHAGVHAFRHALHRAEGGAIGPDVEAAESMLGTKYSQGDRTDCSGMVGRVVEAATGLGGGLPTTQNMGGWLAQRGFVEGLGPAGTLSVGWYNHGSGTNQGHAAMTLSDGENAEAGGSHGNFVIGSGAAGAASSEFDQHMYLPQLYGEGQGGSGGGFGGMGGFGGGGFGGAGGGFGGAGAGGGGGYYTQNPDKMAKANDRLQNATDRLATAREREAEVDKDPKAKQSAKDKARDEVSAADRELAEAKRGQAEAARGDYHAGKGGKGGMSGLPVPLDDKLGTGGGLPGMAKYAISFLEDLVLAPIENGVMAALNGGGGGFGFPRPADADFAPPSLAGDVRADTGSAGDAGSGTGSSGGGGGGPAAGAAPSSWFGHAGTHVAGHGGFFGGAGAAAAAPGTPDGMPPDFAEFARTHPLRPGWDDPMAGMPQGFADYARSHPGIGAPPPYVAPGTPSIGLVPPEQDPAHVAPPPLRSGPQGFDFGDPIHRAGGGRVGYFDEGGGATKPSTSAQPKSVTPQPKPGPVPQPGGGGASGSHPASGASPGSRASSAATMGGSTIHSLPGLKEPGSLGEYVGAGQTPSAGIGFSGGLIGVAESAASSAAQAGITAAAAMYRGGAVGYFGDGGPSGKDTIPAWLAPGEHVLTDDDVHAMGGQDAVYAFRNALHASVGGAVRYFDVGGASAGASAGAPSGGGGGGGGDAAGGLLGPAFAEANRAAAEAAQAGAIGIEGLLSTFKVSGQGTGQDWSKTIPGRLIGGVAGVRPSQNTAGQAQGANVNGAPGTQAPSVTGGMGNVGMQVGHMTVQAQDPNQFTSMLQQQDRHAINSQGMAMAGGAGSLR